MPVIFCITFTHWFVFCLYLSQIFMEIKCPYLWVGSVDFYLYMIWNSIYYIYTHIMDKGKTISNAYIFMIIEQPCDNGSTVFNSETIKTISISQAIPKQMLCFMKYRIQWMVWWLILLVLISQKVHLPNISIFEDNKLVKWKQNLSLDIYSKWTSCIYYFFKFYEVLLTQKWSSLVLKAT